MPEEFGRMTILEFNITVEGYYKRKRKELEKEAAWITVLVNHMPLRGRGAKALKVHDLIGMSEKEKKELQSEMNRKRAERRKRTYNEE